MIHGVAALEREKAAALAAKKPINLIPRPNGQAGRSSGYNLQEAMKLEEDSERYNRLYVRYQFLSRVVPLIICSESSRTSVTSISPSRKQYLDRTSVAWRPL